YSNAEYFGPCTNRASDRPLIGSSRFQVGNDCGTALPSHCVRAHAGVPGVEPERPGGDAIVGVPIVGETAVGLLLTAPGGVWLCFGCSLDSVNCTVQARCSPVSTSKNPVRS